MSASAEASLVQGEQPNHTTDGVREALRRTGTLMPKNRIRMTEAHEGAESRFNSVSVRKSST